ncbi:MAG: hypothetical protein PVI86_05785 [Phycisphaerae bacterium]|jgi:hypothetical protein
MLMTVLRMATFCLAYVVAGSVATAETDTAKNRFYRAYYLENEKGDCAKAADLYEKVARDDEASRSLRARAAERLVACHEELASRDLMRLMPPDAWAYVELNRPGDHLLKFLDELGLTAAPGRNFDETKNRLAVSPALIKGALGIGGFAAAVTGFDPSTQVPQGVLVFHPGNLELIRGALETGLPAGGRIVKPIDGYATYDIEGEALITLTSRLVIVSTERDQIEGVVRRLHGDEDASLATNPAVEQIIENRDDALVLFFVNAKPMMPMLMGIMKSEMPGDEFAKVQALVDINSLNSVMGRLGVGDDGLFLDVGLRLDEGHHNLVYNLLRTPAINPDTLKCVPEGVAAVWIGALNEASSRYRSGTPSADGAPVVSFLDFGREVFANITSLALFVLPPDEGSVGGPPIPDVAAAITVNDPEKSEALWSLVLGIAGMAAGAPGIEGSPVEIQGTTARNFQLPDGINIYFATVDHDVLIASTKSAIARTVEAKRTGKSILDDDAYTAALAQMGPATTKAMFVHAGRASQIARRFVPPSELEEAAPIMALLTDTVASVITEHSGELFQVSTVVTGLPDVGGLVSQLIAKQHKKNEAHAHLRHAMRENNWDAALQQVDKQLDDQPGDLNLLRTKFKILAVNKGDEEAAKACGEAILENAHDQATTLNNIAWALLTEDQYGDAYTELALKMSERSNKLTKHENWAFLDTLAWAKFKTGDADAAVKLEKKAIEHCKGSSKAELEKALAKFEDARDDE